MFYGVPPARSKSFYAALQYIANTYTGCFYGTDMLVTLGKSLYFRNDSKFMASYTATASNEQEVSLLWRVHTLAWAAQHVANSVEGDFVECGVFKGYTSTVVCKYLEFQNLPRKFYLYDTFDGLPEETSTEEERSGWNQYYKQYDSDKLYKEVQDRFSAFPNVQIVRGWVPKSFEEAVPDKIAYLHIDMNSAQAEILALEELFPRMSPGAILVFDDFGWLSNLPQAVAETEFMSQYGHKILELPTGQGLVIKQ